jgi:chromosome segregation ATPase
VTDTNTEIDAKKADVKKKEGEKDASNEAISEAQEDLEDAQKRYGISQDELKTLRELCSSAEAEEQKEERRARRKQEIEALREALNILREVGFLARA